MTMAEQARTVVPGPAPRQVRTSSGQILDVPDGWALLPPGDAALTRRVKAGGACWTVQEKKGRRTFSLGVWAPADRIASVRTALEAERSDPAYTRKLEAGRRRRAQAQASYVEQFEAAIVAFLDFPIRHAALANALATAVAAHATPVGSGTVARTKRIPVQRRAEAAVIAWLRHHTTAYDSMVIPNVKGARRETRAILAAHSRKLLDRYRRGEPMDGPSACVLTAALDSARLRLSP